MVRYLDQPLDLIYFPVLCCPVMVHVVPEKKDMLIIVQLQGRKARAKVIWGTINKNSIFHSSSSLLYSK